MKRSILLAIATLALALVLPTAAFANDGTSAAALAPGDASPSETSLAWEAPVELNLIQSGQYSASQVDAGARVLGVQAAGLTDAQVSAIRKALADGLPSLRKTISLSGARITASSDNAKAIQAVVSDFVNSNPDLFYVNNGMQLAFDEITGYYVAMAPSYSYADSKISDMKSKYENAIDAICSAIPSGATAVQKAKFVHDWLVCHNLYNDSVAATQNPGAASDKTPWNAYGALVSRKPVCEGFSLAYIAVMNRLDISCTYVAQEIAGAGHGWNRVELDGAWYNVDVTWDENATNKKAATSVPDATYFLKSDAWFRAHPDKRGYHKTWAPAGTAGTDTGFDSRKTSSWKAYFKLVAKPKAKTLTYTGAAQTGVASSAGYTLDGTSKATAAGSYKATAKLNANYVWSDATTGTVSTTWKIARASISRATVSGIANRTFTGASIALPKLALKYNGAKLVLLRDFMVKYANAKAAGTATVTISGKGNFTGTLKRTFTIAKAKNTMKVKAKSRTITVKYSKKKASTVARAKVFSFAKKAKGTITFAKASGNKKITVSKTGKITVEKGLARGAYKLTVKVKAKGTSNYKSATMKVTVKIRVK